MTAIRLTVVCLGLIVCSPASAQDVVTPSDRVSTQVNVRATADVTAAEIAQLTIGAALPLIRSVPGWYEVQLADGRSGFVSKAWTTVSRALLPRKQDELRIHFLNIGAGTCTVVECPGSNAAPMIVDCGSTGATPLDMSAQQTRAYVREVLSHHEAPPNVVLSHADLDHYSHIAGTLDDLAVSSVWLGGESSEYSQANFRSWLTDQESRGAAIHRDSPPHFHNERQPVSADLSCGDAATFVLTANTGSAKNARSLVLMIEYEDFTAVFTGDAEGATEKQAVANYAEALKATVLTSSHHGASTAGSNSSLWAAAMAPEVLISSAGNRFFHPRCVATDRFTTLAITKGHDVRCGTSNSYITSRTPNAHYVTAVNGTIIITSNGLSPMTVNCTRSPECGVKVAH
jgi:competence protein ComEC